MMSHKVNQACLRQDVKGFLVKLQIVAITWAFLDLPMMHVAGTTATSDSKGFGQSLDKPWTK
jgi:hypothetical protein